MKKQPPIQPSSHEGNCPYCHSPMSLWVRSGYLQPVCPICGYQAPSVTRSGLESTDEQYE
ncbi:MAG: hypothetical protein ACOX7F_02820 [Eubacteriales bacterium]|jgi:hypothetical protein